MEKMWLMGVRYTRRWLDMTYSGWVGNKGRTLARYDKFWGGTKNPRHSAEGCAGDFAQIRVWTLSA